MFVHKGDEGLVTGSTLKVNPFIIIIITLSIMIIIVPLLCKEKVLNYRFHHVELVWRVIQQGIKCVPLCMQTIIRTVLQFGTF